jgi:hypothetical protein
MATDDRRMHEGRSRSLDEQHRGHERHEEPVSEGDRIGTDYQPDSDSHHQALGNAVFSTNEAEQGSALGGHVATRSGTAETPEDERDG